jgi:cobalt-zinc-cadmium efflux system membrane fusion protein
MRPSWLVGAFASCAFGLLASGCSPKQGGPGESTPPAAPPVKPGQVVIDRAAVKRASIKVGQVKSELLIGGLRVPAELKLDHHLTSHVTALVAGQVRRLNAKTGDRVKAGQVLAVLQSATLGQSHAALTTARTDVKQAKLELLRQQKLVAAGIGARKRLFAAQARLARAQSSLAAARARLSSYGGGNRGGRTELRSPQDGEVIGCTANRGELVKPGEHLYEISDLSHVWAIGRVYEQDIAVIRLGAPALVTLTAYPGRHFRGKVDHVSATLDERTRTLAIRVELKNPQRLLKPGLFGEIHVSPSTAKTRAVMVVPAGAIQRLHGEDAVFVPVASEKPKMARYLVKHVRIGRRVGGLVEVLDGLKAGQRVVVSGTFTLKSELLKAELQAEE